MRDGNGNQYFFRLQFFIYLLIYENVFLRMCNKPIRMKKHTVEKSTKKNFVLHTEVTYCWWEKHDRPKVHLMPISIALQSIWHYIFTFDMNSIFEIVALVDVDRVYIEVYAMCKECVIQIV